ncbi:MAG: DUF6722 family protein [Bacteroidia bacterium]
MNQNEFDKEVGKYFLDISKLIFAGVVLASIIKIEDISKTKVSFIGFIVTLILALIGFIILKPKK